jgi:hypothetical protein
VTPTIGRIVHYTLSQQDAEQVNRRRSDSQSHIAEHRDNSNGVQIHFGNSVSTGDVYPLIITRVWGSTPESAVNGQVLLDGNDSLWVTSVVEGDAAGQYVWPKREAS